MEEIKIPDVVDIEWVRKEMESTGKKHCNKDFVFYTYIKDNLRILDLRTLPKTKVNGRTAISWRDTEDIEVDCMIDNSWYKIKLSCIKGSKPTRIRVFYHKSFLDISPSHLREIQIRNLLKKEETLWDAAINYREYFKDITQAQSILPYSRNLIELYCKNCDYTHKTSPTSIMGNPIYRCPICGDNTSNNEKWVWAYLKGNNKRVTPQKTFTKCRGTKRELPFDFYIEEDNTLVEVQGVGHYEPTFGIKAFKETQKNDRIKQDFCMKEGINLICVNASEGTKEAIINSELKDYIDTSINIDNILTKLNIDSQYPVKKIVSLYVKENKSIAEISKITNLGISVIINLLKRQKVHEPNKFYKGLYDENKIIQQLKSNLSINKIMESNNVSRALVYKIAYKNNLSNRRKLGRESEMKEGWSRKKGLGGIKVKCLNNGKVFNSMKEASDYAGLSNGSKIGMVCNDKRETAGKHPVTGEPLRWKRVEEQDDNDTYSNNEEILHIA